MLVIGFGHEARQGKDTAAQAILESTPIWLAIHRYAFADALKMEVRRACAQFGGQYELIQTWQAEGIMPEWVEFEEPKPRSLLQWWGQWRRQQHPDYWIKKLDTKLQRDRPQVALITDVRYGKDDGPRGDETDYIHGIGGLLVKVINTNPPDVVVPPHVSERSLSGYKGWDYTIKAASVRDCQMQAVDIYQEIVRDRGFQVSLP